MNPRSIVKVVAKLVVSLGLLAWLVAEIGTERIARALSSTDLLLVAAAFLLICADNGLRSFNWKVLLGARASSPAFPEVLYAFLVGGFFGSFIPSSLGPDVARTVGLSRRTGLSLSRTGSSVVMLNLLGLWALGVMFLVGIVLLLAGGSVPDGLWGLAAAAAAGVVGLPAVLATRAPLPRLEPSTAVGRRLLRFVQALAEYRSAGRPVWVASGISLMNQAAAVLVVFTVFRAGGLDVPLVHFMAIVPIVHVARLVPASVAGFGAEQGVVVGLFGLVGVPAASALAMSVIVSALNLGFQAVSGLLYVGASARRLGHELRGSEGSDASPDGRASDAIVPTPSSPGAAGGEGGDGAGSGGEPS